MKTAYRPWILLLLPVLLCACTALAIQHLSFGENRIVIGGHSFVR